MPREKAPPFAAWDFGGLSLRLAAGGVLMASGYLKALRPPEEFAAALEGYWFLPLPALIPLARALPWVELFAGLWVVAGFQTRRAAAVSGALYAAFIIVVGQALLRKLNLADCGCFGQWGPHLKPQQVIFLDAFLFTASFGLWRRGGGKIALDTWVDPDSRDAA